MERARVGKWGGHIRHKQWKGGREGQAPGQFKVMAGAGPGPPMRGEVDLAQATAQQDDDKDVAHACITSTVQAKITQEGPKHAQHKRKRHTAPISTRDT
eukprot:5651061-Amphidinium_carterae.2